MSTIITTMITNTITTAASSPRVEGWAWVSA